MLVIARLLQFHYSLTRDISGKIINFSMCTDRPVKEFSLSLLSHLCN